MLDDDLFEMIDAEKDKELKVILMGDPAQIPPVNKVDSVPFIPEEREKWGIEHALLETIMRQKGDNKILQTAYQIRNGRFEDRDPILSRISNDDVHFYNSMREESKNEFISLMIKHFLTDEFNKNPNHCKVIAWTNKMVNTCNEIIRRSIYKKEPLLNKIMLGEKLIANKPIFNEEHDIIFSTSDEFVVEEFTVKTVTYFLPEKGNELLEQLEMDMKGADIKGKKGDEFNFKIYDCFVRFRTNMESEGVLIRIEVLHEDSEKAFWFMQKKLKGRKNWQEYTNNIEKYADVKYNYAITAHKSQGSTYGTVYLIEDDIDHNRRTIERNRIKYTACTRPKDKLFILSKLNPSKQQQDDYRASADMQYSKAEETILVNSGRVEQDSTVKQEKTG
jgi:ATP-dependent exoDNAse (exonuclease V) alpha subunit